MQQAGIPESNNCISDFDIDTVLSEMTVHEKCTLLAGADGWHTAGCPRLGIPPIMMTDGPNGLRKQAQGSDALGFTDSEPATCFPTESALACSFDPDLIEHIGKALGEECRRAGVSMLLGPGINMKRSPLCGRNFEYYSEDPVLAGTLASAHIKGIQSMGVGASLKHFAGNSQEKARMSSDSVIAPRALHEIYMRAFSIAVKSKPWAVMTAYNRLNGTFCSQNSYLIFHVLRGLWHYRGMTVTDWEALSSLSLSLPAGLDLVMPGPREDYIAEVESCVTSHEISQTQLDEAVRRVLEVTKKSVTAREIPYTCDVHAHLDLAEKAAERSAVLLKNDDNVLPVSNEKSVAVIGAFALHARFQGTGSSRVHPITTDNFLQEFRKVHTGARVQYAPGYDLKTGESTKDQLQFARYVASHNDVAIVYVGLPEKFESEGFDRTRMRLPESQMDLVLEVCANNPHTVVVVVGGAPVEMPWRRRPQAILLTYLSGCQGGRAAANLISGKANPSGKLAETWPERLEDTPTAGRFPDTSREILYTEDIYMGYRYYDAVGAKVAYPFGFGLSYTTFEYTDLSVEPLAEDEHSVSHEAKNADQSIDEAMDAPAYRVSCTVYNTGERDGRETVQLYVAPQSTTFYHAPQTLQAFQSVFIPAGQTRRVQLILTRKAFAYWCQARDTWSVEAGDFEIRMGASSRDIRLSQTIHVDGDKPVYDGAPLRYHKPYAGCFSDASVDGSTQDMWGNAIPDASSSDPNDMFTLGFNAKNASSGNADKAGEQPPTARDDFRQIYGHHLPKVKASLPFTLDSTLSDAANSRVGRMFYPLVMRGLQNTVKDEQVRQRYESMLNDMPIKSVHMQGYSMNAANVMVQVLNGHYGKASRLWWSKRIENFQARMKKRREAGTPTAQHTEKLRNEERGSGNPGNEKQRSEEMLNEQQPNENMYRDQK